MNEPRPHPNMSVIIAAIIVAAGLVTAALILAHRPSDELQTSAWPKPPLTQASAAQQFRAQMLAAPVLHTFQDDKNVNHTLTDVKVTQVIYTHTDDTFTLNFQMSWQPALPEADQQEDGYSITLGNDGYGHYYSPISLTVIDGLPHPGAEVTLQ